MLWNRLQRLLLHIGYDSFVGVYQHLFCFLSFIFLNTEVIRIKVLSWKLLRSIFSAIINCDVMHKLSATQESLLIVLSYMTIFICHLFEVMAFLGSGVAQLVERSLPIPEVRSSNLVIGKNCLYWTFVYCQLCIEKMKIRKKEAGDGPFF